MAAVRAGEQSVEESGRRADPHDTEADELEGASAASATLRSRGPGCPVGSLARAGRGCRHEREALVTV